MSALHWHDFDRAHLRHAALRWAAAGLVIVGAHAAVAYGALAFRAAPPPAEPAPAAMMIELAPMAVSAPSQLENVTPGPQAPQSEEVISDTVEETKPVEEPPKPVEQVQKPVERPVEPMPRPVEQALVEEVTPPLPSPTPSDVVLPMPKPAELKTAEEEKPKPRKKVERKREPEPKRRRQQASTAAAPPRSTAPQARTTTAPSAGAAAVSSSALASWRARAFAHLMRHQRPMPGHQGRVVLAVALSGSGGVRSVRVVRSSRDSALDRQAVSMVQRASPFPAPPGGRPLNVSSVPISFVER